MTPIPDLKIPDTSTAATFIAVTGKYPPLFYSSGETGPTLGSVNAGNQQLYVGGGGINRGFAGALTAAGQTTAEYSSRHNALLASTAVDATGAATYDEANPISFSIFNNSPVAHDDRTGLTFVDVFGPSLQPDGNAANMAMIYTTSPDGRTYPTRDGFLADVTATARKLVESVAAYNGAADGNEVPSLEALRMCLYSSGIFNAHYDDDGTLLPTPDTSGDYIGKDGTAKSTVSFDVIALRIYDGLVAGLSESASGLTQIQFPYSTTPTDPLFNAVRRKLEGNTV